MADPKKIIDQRHPNYQSNVSKWAYYADHVLGGVDYSQKVNPISTAPSVLSRPMPGLNRYIVQHALESSESYFARVSRAPFVDICSPAVELLAGTVGTADSVTLDIPKNYQDFIDDIDMQGNSFLQFMESARRQAAIYGHVFLLTDSSKAQGEIRTQADVLRQGIRPFTRMILPQDMLSWRLDANGSPLEILFRIRMDCPGSLLDAPESSEEVYEYRLWTRNEWFVYQAKGDSVEMVDQGINRPGIIPLSVLYHRMERPFVGESLLKNSAKYSQLLSNWLSDLDSTMTMQSHSQACIRSEVAPAEIGVGAASVLHLRPEVKEGDQSKGEEDFFYRAPDSAPLDSMWAAFFKVVSMANQAMGLSPEAESDSAQPESGISRAWRWHSMEKKLVTMAVNEQEAARSVLQHAAMWRGEREFPGSIVYGTQFDMQGTEDKVAQMLSLQAAGIPPTARRELMRQCLKGVLPNLDPKVQAIIDQELDRMASVTAAIQA